MENRRHDKRFRLDLVELDGEMFIIDNVEIVNISLGGVSLRTDRRLIPGKNYLIAMVVNTTSISLRCRVVHCDQSGGMQQRNGIHVQEYTSGITFRDGQTELIAEFIQSLEQFKVPEVAIVRDRRLHVRFRITIPLNTILSSTARFAVKTISMNGMLIQSDQALEINSLVPMGLSLMPETWINFDGKIVSCQSQGQPSQERYDIGVAFSHMHERDKVQLATFVDHLAETQ